MKRLAAALLFVLASLIAASTAEHVGNAHKRRPPPGDTPATRSASPEPAAAPPS